MSTDQPNADFAADEPAPGAEADLAPEADAEAFSEDDGVLYDEEVKPEYGVLGFTLRELLIVAAWLVAFIVSFFPLYTSEGVVSGSLWSTGIQWILPIGVPTVAVFLVVLRRFSPDGIRRVGSLGIDQFASVAFSVAAVYWAQTIWEMIAASIRTDAFLLSWLAVIQLLAMLALVAFTVFAPLIPGLREDFHGRLVTLAHRNANPVRPVIARPRTERPSSQGQDASAPAGPETEDAFAYPSDSADAGSRSRESDTATTVLDVELSGQSTTDEIERLGLAGQVPLTSHASGGDTGTAGGGDEDDYVPGYARRSRGQDDGSAAQEDVDATNPRNDVPAAQPFWALAPTERDVYDERGEPLFRIGPTAWALVIEDRGGAYVVRHDDGRVGYLHDISDMTKG